MKREFEEFQRDSLAPPEALSSALMARVRAELNPSAWAVFAKLAFIHLFSAAGVLSVCPQFGFRLVGEGAGLMGYFMQFGQLGCTLACGSLFLGASVFFALLFLSAAEIRVLRGNRLLELGALVLLSLGFFIMMDAEEIVLGFAAAWVAGSLLGGLLTLELGWRVRRLLAAGSSA